MGSDVLLRPAVSADADAINDIYNAYVLTSTATLQLEPSKHTILAGTTGEQSASVALHQRFGFVKVAHLQEVGFKFDRFLDVVFMQRRL